MKQLTIALLTVLTCALTAPAQTGNENSVVAVVNAKAITRHDILKSLAKEDVVLAELPASEQVRVFEGRKVQMVLDILREEAAKRSGISISQEDYINIRSRVIERDYGGQSGFESFLREQGMTEEEFDTGFRRRQEQAAWLRVVSGRGGARLSRDLRPLFDMTIRPREMREYYEKNLEKEFTFDEQARVRVIQAYFTRKTKNRIKAKLLGLKRKLATKADFAVLAAKNSDHTSKAEGGLLPDLVKGKGTLLPEPIEEEIFKEGIEEGAVIGPILNVNSYWLVEVEGRQHARKMGFEEAQQQIRGILYGKKAQKAVIKVQLDLVKEAYISPPNLKRRVRSRLEAQLFN